MANLLGKDGDVTVIDVEATGLFRTDRVVEVAVVIATADGVVEEEFETLVNPMRGIGASCLVRSSAHTVPTICPHSHLSAVI